MQLSALRNLVASYLDDPNFGYFTQAQIDVWLNNGQKEVQKRLIKAGQNYYHKTVSTYCAANQQDYILPADCKKIHRIELVDGGVAPNETKHTLAPITVNQQDIVQQGPGVPMAYTLKRDRLVIFPMPLSTYKLNLLYSYAVADMVDDTDEPDVPEQYHELIALIAAEDGFIKDGRASDLLVKRMADFTRQLDSDAQERNQDVPRTIIETGSFGDTGFYW